MVVVVLFLDNIRFIVMLMYQNLALHGWCYALLVLRIRKDLSAFRTSVIVAHTDLGQLYKYIISLFTIKLHDKYSVISLVHTCAFLFCYKQKCLAGYSISHCYLHAYSDVKFIQSSQCITHVTNTCTVHSWYRMLLDLKPSFSFLPLFIFHH